jgi:lambda family phage minor tail protein L
MTEIIDTVQLQEVGDSLVDLYEIQIRGEADKTIYLYNELEGGTNSVYFNAKEGPSYTVREYIAFPLELTGIEYNSDGAAARPTLAMANVLSLVTALALEDSQIGEALDAIAITKNQDLLGSKVTRRRTLAKYLSSPTGGGTVPIEFPSQTFILDRVSSENNIFVQFEVASPFDLEGVVLPSRVVVGKYCPWKYQGATAAEPMGGCTWPQNSNNVFFTADNTLITGVATYSSITNYSEGAQVEFGNRIWQALRASTGKQPDNFPVFWKRIDVCGKTITSCKIRFENGLTQRVPLPFGGFPGTRKFK